MESVLYSFAGYPEGFLPFSGVTFDSAGNLYGTTFMGGAHGSGTAYELTPSASGWTETILHSLSGADGGNPYGGLSIDQQGNLYGMTSEGGGPNGGGTVYQLQPSGGSWTFNVLYSWDGGMGPFDTPTLDSSGNLYGTTSGGSSGFGAVFKLTPVTHDWTYTGLYNFSSAHFNDGFSPVGGVVLDGNGNIYGTIFQGGSETCGEGCGVAWEITP